MIQCLPARHKASRRRDFLSRGPLTVEDVGTAIIRAERPEPVSLDRLATAFCVTTTSVARILDVSFERMAMRAWCGKSPQVYAVRFEHPYQDSLVKVGFTNDLSRRLPQLISDFKKIAPTIDRRLIQWRQIFGVRFTSHWAAFAFEQMMHACLHEDAIEIGREWYHDTWGVGKFLMHSYCCCVELSEARIVKRSDR